MYSYELPKQATGAVREALEERASEDLCAAVVETMGDGLRAQGSGTSRGESDARPATKVLLVGGDTSKR